MASILDGLGLIDMSERGRCAEQKWTLKTKAEENTEEDRLDARLLEKWRKAVFVRDKFICRCCLITVIRSLKAVLNRAEAHHIHGRGKDLRYEVRAGITLCEKCHRRVTGMVNDKLKIVGTKFFKIGAKRYINARFPVQFKKAA